MSTIKSIQDDLDGIVKELQLYHFTNELNYAKNQLDDKNKLQTDNDKVRVEKLETILATLTRTKKDERKEYFEKLDAAVYHQSWRKLPQFHRNVKLKEYIKNNYNDENVIKQLEELLLDNAELNTDKLVVYNTEKMKIESIPPLILDETTQKYTLKFKIPKTTTKTTKNT